MQGLSDFRGNSQNFDSGGEEIGARAFRAAEETWEPGQEREAAWGERPGGVETPGTFIGVSPSFPEYVMLGGGGRRAAGLCQASPPSDPSCLASPHFTRNLPR